MSADGLEIKCKTHRIKMHGVESLSFVQMKSSWRVLKALVRES